MEFAIAIVAAPKVKMEIAVAIVAESKVRTKIAASLVAAVISILTIDAAIVATSNLRTKVRAPLVAAWISEMNFDAAIVEALISVLVLSAATVNPSVSCSGWSAKLIERGCLYQVCDCETRDA